MEQIAEIHTQQQTNGQHRDAQAKAISRPHRAVLKTGLVTTKEDWMESPGGMMSLADMLKQAGYGRQLEEWILPLPTTPAPPNY
eukprot:2303929-Karenia_brevis.AAC.1